MHPTLSGYSIFGFPKEGKNEGPKWENLYLGLAYKVTHTPRPRLILELKKIRLTVLKNFHGE